MKVHMQPKRLPLCPKPYQTEHQVQELPTSNSYPKKDDLYATCVTLPIQLSFIIRPSWISFNPTYTLFSQSKEIDNH